jgi:dipeptidase
MKRRLFNEITPKKSKESTITTPVLLDLIINGPQSQSATETITASSSMLKRNEQDVKNDPKRSPDLSLSHQQQQQRPIDEQQQQEQHLLQVRDDFLSHINFD